MSKLTKIVTLTLMTGMLVMSLSANAAGHKCAKGMKWDATKKVCIKK